jgi:two-component system chemotaxis response regulator CheB
VVLDVNMPKINGIQLLRMLQKDRIRVKVMMASTDTKEGAAVTLEALELGAIDFIEKPNNIAYLRTDNFRQRFLDLLEAVTESRQTNVMAGTLESRMKQEEQTKQIAALRKHHEDDVHRLKEENCLICYALSACLDGLQQLGANHTVPLAKEKLDKYLNQQAHE